MIALKQGLCKKQDTFCMQGFAPSAKSGELGEQRKTLGQNQDHLGLTNKDVTAKRTLGGGFGCWVQPK